MAACAVPQLGANLWIDFEAGELVRLERLLASMPQLAAKIVHFEGCESVTRSVGYHPLWSAAAPVQCWAVFAAWLISVHELLPPLHPCLLPCFCPAACQGMPEGEETFFRHLTNLRSLELGERGS